VGLTPPLACHKSSSNPLSPSPVVGIQFVYVPTLLAGALTLVPVITPLIVTAPAAVFLAWSTGWIWPAAVFLALHCYVSLWVIPDIYESRISVTVTNPSPLRRA
jgi:predicted PurR-regulated permease PerM